MTAPLLRALPLRPKKQRRCSIRVVAGELVRQAVVQGPQAGMPPAPGREPWIGPGGGASTATPAAVPEPRRAAEPFLVMAKPVGPICNLACTYCYYLETRSLYQRPHQFRMTDVLLERYIRQYIEASPGPLVHFVWHGGEPTLAGLDFYRRAVQLQRRHLPEGWTCWNNLQTNGTLLNDDWCAFLAEERFEVGLSIDGTERPHDTFRRYRNGRRTYAQVAAAVDRLRRRGVHPDLLCTVTAMAADDPLGTYRRLRDLGGTFLQFLPIVRRGPDGRPTPESVTPEAYGRFLCAVFDEWVGHDLGTVVVQLFGEAVRAWAGQVPGLCVMAPTCGRVLVLEHDGAVYSCDHFVDPAHRLGNVATVHLGALADTPAQIQFGADKHDRLPAQCRVCPWLAACNGGCPKDRFGVTGDGEPGLNYLCDGLRRFFAYADPVLRRLVDVARSGARPTELMAEVRAHTRARWHGIGRNDPCPCGSGHKAKRCCWSLRP